ncbi:MAG: hypothetical protein ACREVL_17805 [Solimonas sp.]
MAMLPEQSQASVKGGIWFVFPLAGRTIRAWGSAAGLERIYVDEEVVSEQRRMRRISEHPFSLGGEAYVVRFTTTSYLKGMLECTLSKGESRLAGFRIRYASSPYSLKRTLLSLAAGAVIGAALAHFRSPILGLAIVLALVLLVQAKARKPISFIIETMAPAETGAPDIAAG